jgi:hypothetical protein
MEIIPLLQYEGRPFVATISTQEVTSNSRCTAARTLTICSGLVPQTRGALNRQRTPGWRGKLQQ